MASAIDAASLPSPVGATPLSSGTPKILMCPPEYFTVEYAINPWMENIEACDTDLAKKQWDKLYQAITAEAGADVLLMEPVEGLPDLVFTANAAFVYNDTAIIAHYRHAERQGEEPHCERWFKKHGFKVVTMPPHIHFEGAGDALTWLPPDAAGNENPVVFAGYKTRTDIASHNLLSTETGLPVYSMELIDERFYHIDVCICPLATGHFLYNPDAFDDYGNTIIEANVPEAWRIPVTAAEASRFACNTVNINDTVLFNRQADQRLQDELKSRGFNVIQVDLSEFLKSGGSSKCLTLRVG